ncbi:MAG: hypothetical protein V4675_12950 [Verrucomicrobiota bacterium]
MSRLIIFCLAAGGFCLTTPFCGAEPAQIVSRTVEIPRLWQPDQHLYVKGDIGLPAGRLAALEDWLDVHAPHWTVVLMDEASGESWQETGGGRYTGMDAVEYALGQELPAKTAFGKFTHPQTGERDGAWLVIFLRERKFSYWAADAYDRRRLGEDRWQGNLDSAAKQAMRGGGRIVDAVQDTITSIDGDLKRRITQEVESRRQEQERQERLRTRTGNELAGIRQAVQRAAEQATSLRRDLPQAAGDLAKPPVDRWLASLEEAAALLPGGPPDQVAGQVEKVRAEVEAWETAFTAHRNAPDTIRNLQQEMDAIELHAWSGAARADLLIARGLLREATAAHARADTGFAKFLDEASRRLTALRASDAATRRMENEYHQLEEQAGAALYPVSTDAALLLNRARAALAEFPAEREAGRDGGDRLQAARDLMAKARLTDEAAARRAREIRQASQAGGVVGSAALLLGGWAGNRRRRKIKERATTLFQQWEEALQKKTNELFSLLDRAGRAIGSSAVLERSGWSGTTRQLAHQTILDVDQLFVMSSALDQVLERARALVRPANPLSKGRNLVSGGRYQAAVDLLEQEQIQFSPETQIPTILSTAPDQAWRGLLGRREDCEPFALTFSGLNEAFNERAARALAGLDRIETAWTRIGTALMELDEAIAAAARAEKQVNAAEAEDRRFGVDPVFATLLPAAGKDSATATGMAVSDPVQALEGPVAEGSRKAREAQAVCQAVLELRTHLLPSLKQGAETLTKADRQTGWIGEALDSLSAAATVIAQDAADRSILGDLTAWETTSRTLRDRALQSVALMERCTVESVPQMQSLERLIQQERGRLAAALGLTPEQVLTEAGRNPSHALSRARDHHAAALTELDRGDPAGAQRSLNDAAEDCQEGVSLVERAGAAWSGQQARMKALTMETERLTALIPAQAALLDTLRRSWAPAALQPAAADPELPDPDESITDNIRVAEDRLAAAREHTQAGADACQKGALLGAVDFHDQAAADQAEAAGQLAAIQRQREALEATARANAAEAARLDRHAAALQRLADEPVTMQPTRHAFAGISENLAAALAHAAATGPAADPFAAAAALAQSDLALAEIVARLQSDRSVYAEATRSVADAERQLSAATPLIRQAGGDGIPDSPATATAMDSLARLQHILSEATTALQQPHGDWNAVDQTADQLAADAATWRARLQGELARAAASVEAVQLAAGRIRDAAGWSGTLGVLISGAPGQDRLEQARRFLGEGDYEAAKNLAGAALREAQQAIEAAEAEQRRRRREQERQEESRRRAAAERRSSHSTGSAFSGGSRSSGGSSSRSSFSSGSGSSRSGW